MGMFRAEGMIRMAEAEVVMILVFAIISICASLLFWYYRRTVDTDGLLPRGDIKEFRQERSVIPRVTGEIDSSSGALKLHISLFNDHSDKIPVDFKVDGFFWRKPSSPNRSQLTLPSVQNEIIIDPRDMWKTEIPLTSSQLNISQGDELTFEMKERSIFLYQVTTIT